MPVVTTGSSNPPFSVFSEKDTSGNTPVTLHYQSISMMPAYRGSSFEVSIIKTNVYQCYLMNLI